MDLLLERGEIIDLGRIPSDFNVSCRSGQCWVTLSGDSRDYLVGDGQQFTTRTGGHLIICALESSRVQLKAPSTHTTSLWAQLIPCNP
ncbi:MAG: hypothetical protein C0618_07185 [Desulfuromonas sp.]|nr:MAG: hypothetical protein C0618_07185 [Desulfuromonas sp.]